MLMCEPQSRSGAAVMLAPSSGLPRGAKQIQLAMGAGRDQRLGLTNELQ